MQVNKCLRKLCWADRMQIVFGTCLPIHFAHLLRLRATGKETKTARGAGCRCCLLMWLIALLTQPSKDREEETKRSGISFYPNSPSVSLLGCIAAENEQLPLVLGLSDAL